ncbi:MAG: L-threonylcarbamoyladenylate synthase [Bacilli bacterium]|nr:L-threonylcarbamoyladenylate synthase [Bacilli bacterium]
MKRLSVENIDIIIDEIKSGNPVIIPTDTIYGIACDALNKKAVNKIYKIKKRDNNKPLTLNLNKKKDITKYAYITNKLEKEIIKKLMPGAITLLLKKKEYVVDLISKNSEYIGVRIPNNKIVKEIIKKINSPLVLKSVNISGEMPIIDLDDLNSEISNNIRYAIDVGIIDKGVESTIVKVTNNKVEILREGKITKKQIEDILSR